MLVSSQSKEYHNPVLPTNLLNERLNKTEQVQLKTSHSFKSSNKLKGCQKDEQMSRTGKTQSSKIYLHTSLQSNQQK